MKTLLGFTLHRLDVSGQVPVQAHWEGEDEDGAWVDDGPDAAAGTVLGKEVALRLQARLMATSGGLVQVILWPVMEDPPAPAGVTPAVTHTDYRQTRRFAADQTPYERLEKRGLA